MSARRGLGLEVALAAGAVALFLLAAALGRPARSAYTPPARELGVLRVVTWNVGGALSGEAHPARDPDLRRVTETLLELAPDLVFLQEVASEEQVRGLLERLGAGWTATSTPAAGRRVVVLSQDGELTPLEAGGRGERWELVRWERGARTLTAAAVHAHAFSSRRRNEVIGGVLDTLLRLADGPALLAGDLNLDLDLDKRRDLFSDDQYLDVETYNYVAARLTDAARGRGSTAEPDRRLDYVFFDPAAFELRSAGPWKGRRGGDMDHDPVVADLRWR